MLGLGFKHIWNISDLVGLEIRSYSLWISWVDWLGRSPKAVCGLIWFLQTTSLGVPVLIHLGLVSRSIGSSQILVCDKQPVPIIVIVFLQCFLTLFLSWLPKWGHDYGWDTIWGYSCDGIKFVWVIDTQKLTVVNLYQSYNVEFIHNSWKHEQTYYNVDVRKIYICWSY